ncbi:mediator of RNA polymerase II transcription subunit 26-like isoform X2 [Periplaneta americana]|uniref:mediator of RNA polymerase II transcription subunit 26-like isoform X2 n=1 Tax=Periplaneta americana TaxID=6978 RepID=UPI0037E7CCC3
MQHSPSEIKEKLLKALDKEYNVVDMATVVEIIAILERTVITKEALETTRLGKYVNELRRKTTNELLARRAKDLVRRWRVMIQENNNTAGGVAICSHTPAVHQTNGTNLLLHQVSPALRSNASPILSSNRCYSPSLGVTSADITNRFVPNFSISPMNSNSMSEKCVSPSVHCTQSSSVSNLNASPKLLPLTTQVKLRSGSSNSDLLGHQYHPSVLVDIESVPKTHASNKRLRKESPSPEDLPSKKMSRPNGQVTKGFEFVKACMSSQPEIHGDGSRDSTSGLSQASSGCEVVLPHNKVPIEIAATTAASAAVVTTGTTTATTTTCSLSTTCTSTTVPLLETADTVTTCVTTTVCSTSEAGTSSGTTTPSPKTPRGRKKSLKLRRVSASASVTHSAPVGDILKEKIASKVRTPKVKTTQELVASVQAKTGGASDENNPSLAKCILMSRGTSTDALEISRNKTEHIAKFLQSQSLLHAIQEEASSMYLAAMEDFRLRKHLEGLPGDNYNSSPAEVSSLSKDILQQSLSSKDSQSASVVEDRTVEDILAQLPPLDVDAICWNECDESDTPIAKEVNDELLTKLHNQHIEGLNGNISDGVTSDSGDNFKEWHEMVSKKSYQGEFLHILPYVVID